MHTEILLIFRVTFRNAFFNEGLPRLDVIGEEYPSPAPMTFQTSRGPASGPRGFAPKTVSPLRPIRRARSQSEKLRENDF